ncbi:helix-turn-helix domain-containing protein [Dehalococcoidia bacterium]|nr:helix-turn-helix domain-containing protein [Dehalococcoidia bacterium]
MDFTYKEAYSMNPKEARKRLIDSLKFGGISQTAKLWSCSKNTVRKWKRRYEELGEVGLEDLPRKPQNSPRKTPPQTEEKVIEAKKKTGYGRKRLAWYLFRNEEIELSPNTIRHILRRHGYAGKRKKRKVYYPAHWAWEVKAPFSLIQIDVKDIMDKATLGAERWDHIRKRRLPRYQWTWCEAKTRLRFLAYSYELNLTNGLAFLILTTLWIRRFGISNEVVLQTDWGQEFGGDNPKKINLLEEKYLLPLGAQLKRIPLGRKGYNGRVERSHRTDDEELYIPYILEMDNAAEMLSKAASWVYYYNVVRPHFGGGMKGKSPLEKLCELSYTLPEEFILFPPVILDEIGIEFLIGGGHDVLAYYSVSSIMCPHTLPLLLYSSGSSISLQISP